MIRGLKDIHDDSRVPVDIRGFARTFLTLISALCFSA